MERSRPRALFPAIAACLGLLLALATGELSLRLIALFSPDVRYLSTAHADPPGGRPASLEEYLASKPEQIIPYRQWFNHWTNALGFHDEEFVVPKPCGPRDFTRPAWCAVAGLLGGLGLLTKWTYPVYDSRATPYRVTARAVSGWSAAAFLERLHAEAPRALDWAVRDARGLALDVEPYADAETRAGRLRRLTLRAESARVGDFRRKPVAIRVQDAELTLENVRLNPHALAVRGDIELLGAGRLVIRRAVISASDLAQALAELAPWLQRPAVSVADGQLRLDAGIGGVRVAISLRPDLEAGAEGRLAVWAERARLGPVPLPAPLVNAALGLLNPVVRLAERPLPMAPPRVTLADGCIVLETR